MGCMQGTIDIICHISSKPANPNRMGSALYCDIQHFMLFAIGILSAKCTLKLHFLAGANFSDYSEWSKKR